MSLFIRYFLVAAVAYVVDMGGFYSLLQLDINPVIANVVVKVLAAICGFFMHRSFTYRITADDDKITQAIKYFGLALIYTPVSSVLLYLLIFLVPQPIYAKGIIDILLFIITFWVTSNFAFKFKK